ncbi:MAG: MaoC family dehydratase [Alphaproteobacteria bacterium]|nr:MaoC family dehydratase [Alphaproteobacteria bacterium]
MAPRAADAKTTRGNFFEDFTLGQRLTHATPRTVTAGDAALYTALYGPRFAVQSSAAFARACGLPDAPIDDFLVFHVVFGKTVPDISLNAVANLGYADCRFAAPVYPGDTLATESQVIGLKENSNRKTGIVYVRSTGANQRGETVLDYVRWVMVRKGDPEAAAPDPVVPDLPGAVAADALTVPEGFATAGYDVALSGSGHRWDDYAVGERIDHVDAMTIEEAEHQLATRLYQNTARVHFDARLMAESPAGRRLIYGGHIISLARALSFNGLANAWKVAAINGGQHTNPTFAGDTISAWSEVLDKAALAGRSDLGALRVRTIGLKNADSAEFIDRDAAGKADPAKVLDLDYWVLLPR